MNCLYSDSEDPSKRQYMFTNLHGGIIQKTRIFANETTKAV